MPIDPAESVARNEIPPMAPPYVDEDVNLSLVEDGLDAAEDDLRDTVADAYEASARLSDDPEESLNDVDYTKDEGAESAPELAAMRGDFISDEEEQTDVEDYDEE